MARVNEHYLKLRASYLFSEIARRVKAFQTAHPEAKLIRLGIGDITDPLPPAVIQALHAAVDEMARAESFHGYGPDAGYEFLTALIAKHDYGARGVRVDLDEIFAVAVETGVALAPGEGFGPSGEHWARASLAVTDETLERGIERLAPALAAAYA